MHQVLYIAVLISSLHIIMHLSFLSKTVPVLVSMCLCICLSPYDCLYLFSAYETVATGFAKLSN